MSLEKISPEEFYAIATESAKAMIEHTQSFFTPISKVIGNDHGEYLGTGSFLSDGESIYLITNEHVARERRFTPLAHQFFDSDSVVKITNQFFEKKDPIDVAIARIKQDVWTSCQHGAQGCFCTHASMKPSSINLSTISSLFPFK